MAIIVAVKKEGAPEGLATVQHGELWGTRNSKYKVLSTSTIEDTLTDIIDCPEPQFPFVRRDHGLTQQYEEGFSLAEFMPVNVTGIVTMGDGFALAENSEELRAHLDDLLNNDNTEASLKSKYGLGKNYAQWILGNKHQLAHAQLKPVPMLYRPFEIKTTYFDNRILWRWREKVMRHMLAGENLGLICPKINKDQSGGLVTTHICGHKAFDAYDSNSLFPLYLYPNQQDLTQSRQVNFDSGLFDRMLSAVTETGHQPPDEVQVFDYIYGILHCPIYLDTYAEFLKINFPRIPWPKTPDEFWEVSEKGALLRELHLMEPSAIGDTPFPFSGNGDNVVNKSEFGNGKVWINNEQCFDAVPEVSWNLYIGGYQPAQKWLKDRKGRKLSFEDVKHYQRIVKVLSETKRIIQTIKNRPMTQFRSRRGSFSLVPVKVAPW